MWSSQVRWRQDRGRARVSLSCVAAWEPTADQRGGRSAGAPRGVHQNCSFHRPAGEPEELVLAEEQVKKGQGGVRGVGVDSDPGSGMLRDGQGSRE